MAKLATKPVFGTGILSGLRATAGAVGGEPLFLLLDQIEEDPDQPRTQFEKGELEQLAETIRLYGVLSPIGVRKLDGERYRLVYGARRLRASRLANQTRIPAIVVPVDKAGLAAQVIENQARANLSNRDLAAVVNRMFAEGMKVKQIAVVCSLKEYQVAAFRSVERLPPSLAARLDQSDMRAIYELFRAWEKHGAVIEAALPTEDVFLTITEARRIIETATGKAMNSVFLTRGKEAAPRPEPKPATEEPEPAPPEPIAGEADVPLPNKTRKEPRRPASVAQPVDPVPEDAVQLPEAPQPTSAAPVAPMLTRPVFIMETADGRRGVLVTDKRAQQAGHVLLDVEGGEVAEVTFSALRPVEVA